MKRKREETETTFKIVLFGDGCTGKSTLFNFMKNLSNDEYQFNKAYQATENFDFERVTLDTNVGKVVIDLWDTAGQENYGGKLRDAYLKGADGVLLLYDVSEVSTKENILNWIEQVKDVVPEVPVAVLGNKSDKFQTLQQNESVKFRDCILQKMYGSKNIKNFLISIKENTNINFTSEYFGWKTNIQEVDGCLPGLEYILDKLLRADIKIEY